jgi:IMP dehydrogenase
MRSAGQAVSQRLHQETGRLQREPHSRGNAQRKEAEAVFLLGFPIINNSGDLVGILTARDIKFLTDYKKKISEVMTKNITRLRVDTASGSV